MASPVRATYFRIDGRSLALFRIALSLLLGIDLLQRFRVIDTFYTNQGPLPNHAHLYHHLAAPVWSALHAVSSDGEARFVFLLCALSYGALLIGHRTRLASLLSLLGYVSLAARNTLLDSASVGFTASLAGLALVLPLGHHGSLDRLRLSLAAREEKTERHLNDRDALEAAMKKTPMGVAHDKPSSLGAIAVLALVLLTMGVPAVLQHGTWLNGEALGRAVWLHLWVSDLGIDLRGQSGLLSAWTHLLRGIQWLVPLLVILPVRALWTRTLAALLLALYGVTSALLFDVGVLGFAYIALATLLLPTELWDRWQRSPSTWRKCTIVYDADCGVCLYLARVLARLDVRRLVTLQGNDDLERLPKGVDPALVDQTLLATDARGRVMTQAAAVATGLRAVPLGWTIAWLVHVPGIKQLANVAYDFIAVRRLDISVSLGFAACGIPVPGAPKEPPPPPLESPLATLLRRAGGVLSEGFAILLIGTWVSLAIATPSLANSSSVKPRAPFENIARAMRMTPPWGFLMPEPPAAQAVLIADAQTMDGGAVDLLTGEPPSLIPRDAARLGPLWSAYSEAITREENDDLRIWLRDYLARHGGPGHSSTVEVPQRIAGFDVFALRCPTSSAIDTPVNEQDRIGLTGYSRGGTFLAPVRAAEGEPRPRGGLRRVDDLPADQRPALRHERRDAPKEGPSEDEPSE